MPIRRAFVPFFEATAREEHTDLNQVHYLEPRITNATYIHEDHVARFADQFFKGELTTQDRLAFKGTVRLAVERFILDVNGGDKTGHAAAQNQASGGVPSAMARALPR